ncbi:leucyl aminopeptidase [bacterium]|nr:leucyl aminopeptidase [bacterium]
MVNIEVSSCTISDIDADAVLVGTFEDTDSHERTLGGDDKEFIKLIRPLIEEREITGKLGSTTLIHCRGEIRPKRILCIGLGPSNELSLDRLRGMSAVSGRYLRDIHCQNIGIHLGFLPTGFRYKDSTTAAVEGFLLGQYRFTKYLNEPDPEEIRKFGIYFPAGIDFDPEEISQAIRMGAIIAQSTNLTRNICNEPANVVTPSKFADIALDLAQNYGFKVTVLDESEIEQLKMNMILAVNAGSVEPPRLIILEYLEAGPDEPVHGLLGKGVTFDSGGVSLKTQTSISHMHLDKTAGAVVLGTAVALSLLKAKVNFIGVIPAVENMLDGRAYKPGDIFESMSGKTIEVINTDAEGRLILADALTYMQRNLGLQNLIDFATLTGGSKRTLGSDIIPVFANDNQMFDAFREACWHSGEACWRMPLFRNYRKGLFSHVAELKNDDNDTPSTILGALFLQEFVEKDTKWMHIDIGGHEFREEEFSYQPVGATALGMRSLIRYFLRLAGQDTGRDQDNPPHQP